jgi:putative transposase
MQNRIYEAFNGRTRDELLMRRSSSISITPDRRWRDGPPHKIRNALTRHSAISPPAEFAGTFTAKSDRLRNPDQLRRSPVAPPALILGISVISRSAPGWPATLALDATKKTKARR